MGGPESAVDGGPDIRGQGRAVVRGRKAVRDASVPYAQEVCLDLPIPGFDLLPCPFLNRCLFCTIFDDRFDNLQPIPLVRDEEPGHFQMDALAVATAQTAQTVHFPFAPRIECRALASVVILQQGLADRAGLGFRPRYVKQPSPHSFIFVLCCDKLTMSFWGPRDALLRIEQAIPGSFLHPYRVVVLAIIPGNSGTGKSGSFRLLFPGLSKYL